jgi:hypothetical protein
LQAERANRARFQTKTLSSSGITAPVINVDIPTENLKDFINKFGGRKKKREIQEKEKFRKSIGSQASKSHSVEQIRFHNPKKKIYIKKK